MLSREERNELEADYKVEPSIVSIDMRTFYFRTHGTYADDATILEWYNNIVPSSPSTTISEAKVSTGGKTDFYDIVGCKDVDDLAEHWNLKGDEFNCLKAIAGIALGARHPGTDPKRDANKLVHYANRIKNRLDKQ